MKALEPIKPDYIERSDRARQKVARRLVQSGYEKFQRAELEGRNVEKSAIAAVRLLRAAGLDWRAARDGQLTFNAFTQNWFEGVKDCLPPDFPLQKMVYAVRVADLMERAPKTLEDCRPALQLMLEATGVFAAPRRLEEQTERARNLYNEVVTHVQRVFVQFQKYKESKPLDQWTEEMLRDFVRTARPLADDVEAAEALLGHVREG